jgi:hypothetical protein
MKNILLLSIGLLFSLIVNSQDFDVNFLIKLRNMNHKEIDAFLKTNNPSWSDGEYEGGLVLYSWNLNQKINIAMLNNKNITLSGLNDVETLNKMMSQIEKFKMKYVKTTKSGTGYSEEIYSGQNYIITISKIFSPDEISYSYSIEKKKN